MKNPRREERDSIRIKKTLESSKKTKRNRMKNRST